MLLLMPSGLSLFFGNTFQNSSTRTQVLNFMQAATHLAACLSGHALQATVQLMHIKCPKLFAYKCNTCALVSHGEGTEAWTESASSGDLSLCPKLLLGATYSYFLHTKFKEKRACSPSLPLSSPTLISLLLPSPRSM